MAKKTSQESRTIVFAGYSKPNYTQVPDELFDEHLAYLSGAELKVLLYIMRRTFGFKKDRDDISFNQICSGITKRDGQVLDQGTGLSKSTAQLAIKGLTEKNLILPTRRVSAERGNEPTTYALHLVAPYAENRHSPIPKIDPALYRKSAPQETEVQETDQQQTDLYSNNKQTITRHKTIDPQGYDKLRVRSNVDNSTEAQPEANDELKDDAEEPTPAVRSVGMAQIADVLSQRQLRPRVPAERGSGVGRDRPPRAPEYLAVTMEDISAKLHDDSPRSSLTLATKLWKRSGLPEDKFVQRVHEATSITRQQGGVRGKPASDDHDLVNRMMYFFPVLEDLVGLKASPPTTS